jgi:hypothetical protein
MIVVMVSSCESPEGPVPVDIGQDYFPLQKGLYQVYDVSETKYELGVPETIQYQLKTQVIDSFLTLDGEYRYVIYRSKRNSEQDNWAYADTWSAQINQQEALMNEGNISFLKLVFPVAKGLEWNGNKYNTGETDDYLLEQVDTSYTFNNFTFDDCLRVIQEDESDVIVYFDQRKEIYARDVGLVYKELIQLSYCTDTSCLGDQQVESGLIFKQTILSHGME